MTTTHPLIKQTNPNYSTGSGLCLEVKFEGQENWSKLKDAEPYNRNHPVSINNQIKQLEECRDSWVTRGQKKYFTAQYRIGRYDNVGGAGYAWVPASHLTE